MLIKRIKIEEIKPQLKASGFISASEEWSKFLRLHFNAQSDFIGVVNNAGELKFVLPAFLRGSTFESVPKLYTQLIKVGEHNEPEPWPDLIKFLKDDKALSAIKISLCFFADNEKRNLSAKDIKGVTHVLKVGNAKANEILTKYVNKKTRNQIKAAYKGGNFKLCIDQNIDDFYDIYLKSIKRLKSIAKPKKYFQDLQMSFGDKLQIIGALYDGKLAGANLILLNDDYLFLLFSVADSEHFKNCINNFIYWETIKFGIAGGIRTFDFGPSVLKDISHHHFKEGFGAHPVPIYKINFYNSIKSLCGDFISTRLRNLRLRLNKII